MLIRVNILMFIIVVNIACSNIMKETLKLNHHYPICVPHTKYNII